VFIFIVFLLIICLNCKSHYRGGFNIEKNPKLVNEYSEKACNYGNINSCTDIGYAYYTGEGNLTKDRAKAIKYLKIASKGGVVWSYLLLAEIYDDKNASKEDNKLSKIFYDKSIDLYTRLAKSGKKLSSFDTLFELLLVNNRKLDKSLERDYLEIYKRENKSLIVYDMLKVFENIYNGKESNLDKWKEKYIKSKLLKKKRFRFTLLERWIEKVENKKIKKELLEALKVFKSTLSQ